MKSVIFISCLALIFISLTASIANAQTVSGWTQADVELALGQNGLSGVEDNTVDPNFPSMVGRTADGFLASGVRMACHAYPAAADDHCNAVWISVHIPATEMRWARLIIDSLERQGRNPLGVNANLFHLIEESGETRPIVTLSHYLISDGGVSPGLLEHQIRNLLSFADQTRDFMLSDDIAHSALWESQMPTE